LYARAYAGDLDGFTGVDDPYQPPSDPDLRITPELALSNAVETILDMLGLSRLVGATTGAAASS
ncbi:MAG TPA: adenylyl-sulfate kinase, partial [Solirubrobacteraceae bacterium]|nr:adenylyl-sulfate kinase [Solirubrobacteraceae bacterium]